MNVLVPSLRNLNTIPPTINFINYLNSTGIKITVFSFNSSKESFSEGIELINYSSKKYPKSFFSRVFSKIAFHFSFYRYLIKNWDAFNCILLGAWDIRGLNKLKTVFGLKTRIIYQFHELEFQKLKYCRMADFCLVPEVNRLWISYFLGNLKLKPLLLPNIPFVQNPPNVGLPSEIKQLKKENKLILLYQGLIDFEKRCLKEILESLKNVEKQISLVIMPSPVSSDSEIKKLNDLCEKFRITDRVVLIESMPTPLHLTMVQNADIGIGLYRPTSLNQIYAAPNRLYEFTNFGIPVILPDFPVFEALSFKYPFGINPVNSEQPLDIANTINALANNKNRAIGQQNAFQFKKDNGNYGAYAQRAWNVIKLNMRP